MKSISGLFQPVSSELEGDYTNHLLLVQYEFAPDTTTTEETPTEALIGGAQPPEEEGEPLEGGSLVRLDGGLNEPAPSALSSVTPLPVLYRSQELRIDLNKEGEFSFELPETTREDVHLKLKSPTGATLYDEVVKLATLESGGTTESGPITLDVDPFIPLKVQAGAPLPYKVRGKIMEEGSGKAVSGRTLLVYAVFKAGEILTDEDGGGESLTTPAGELVATAVTDSSGYFSFTISGESLESLTASLSGDSSQQLNFRLNDNGQAATQQILVTAGLLATDDGSGNASTSDCGCDDPATDFVPTDATDLALSSDTNEDLTGCVDFTTPNRSLEEFDYYTVVRTTEPEVRKVEWQKPAVLSPTRLVEPDNYTSSGNVTVVSPEPDMIFSKVLKSNRYPNLPSTVRTELNYADFAWQLNTSRPDLYQLALLLNHLGYQMGQNKWWVYGTKLHNYVYGWFNQNKAQLNQGRPAGQEYDHWYDWVVGYSLQNAISHPVLPGPANSPYFEFGRDVAADYFQQYYGRIHNNENELHDFWLYCAQDFYRRMGNLPMSPDELGTHILQVILPTGAVGNQSGNTISIANGNFDAATISHWWRFSNNYPGGDGPLQSLFNDLADEFLRVYGRRHTLETELHDFLVLGVEQFRQDYGRIPTHPSELLVFIRDNFKGGLGTRLELTGRHPIDWDDTPTFFHATTIAHGHLLHFKHIWRADGYSLGDLLYSLPLAPGQKKQIAIFDWDRSESGRRDEDLAVNESMDAYLDRDRDVTDIIQTSLAEKLKGGSESSTSGASLALGQSSGGGAAAQGNYKGVNFGGVAGSSQGLGFSASTGAGSSTAWQDSSRQLAGSSRNQLRDKIMQGASAVRSQRATVVQAIGQTESMSVQTEVIANHNHCHAMTMEYFEVLRHFAVENKLVDVQECLFIPLEMTRFTLYKALRWRDELAPALGSRDLREGLDALERIRNYDQQQLATDQIMADEALQELGGTITLSLNINRPADQSNNNNAFDELAWLPLYGLLGAWTTSRIRAAFDNKLEEEKERIYREEILPEMLANFIDQLELGYVDQAGTEQPFDLDLEIETPGIRQSRRLGIVRRRAGLRGVLQQYQPGGELTLRIRLNTGRQSIRRSDISAVYIRNPYALPDGSRIAFEGGRLVYETASLQEVLLSERNRGDVFSHQQGDAAIIPTPMNARELYNPIKDTYLKANRLLNHLNDHLEWYHKVIWYQMDDDKRFMLLDGVVAPNAGGRSVASVVENKLIGITGNSIIMPVAPGAHLDPTYSQDTNDPIDLLQHYRPTTPEEPFRVSVPTRGVYAEAVMGHCNSCEKIDESRFWRFTEVPTGDEPTAIMPINTDSRRADPGDLTAKDLPTNIINFQNAPAAPDPQSLTDVLTALSNPDIFRDLAGLEGTQGNALQALLANQKGAIDAMRMNTEAAQKYAKYAKELAMHASMVKNADKVIDRAEEQMGKNNLDEEKGKEVIYTALKRMSGGHLEGDIVGGNTDLQGESQIQGMLPPNPAQYATYNASNGQGETVSYSTLGSGSVGGEEAPAYGFDHRIGPDYDLELRSNFFRYANNGEGWGYYRSALNVPLGKRWDQAFIGEGASGVHVKGIQEALNRIYPGLNLTEDGNFGPSTKAAIKQFQDDFRVNGMITMVDGVVGPETMRVLDEVMYVVEDMDLNTVTPQDVQDARQRVYDQEQRMQSVNYPMNLDLDAANDQELFEDILHTMRSFSTTNHLKGIDAHEIFNSFGLLYGDQRMGIRDQELSLTFGSNTFKVELITSIPNDLENSPVYITSIDDPSTVREENRRNIYLLDQNSRNIVGFKIDIPTYYGPNVEQQYHTFVSALWSYIRGEIDYLELETRLSQ